MPTLRTGMLVKYIPVHDPEGKTLFRIGEKARTNIWYSTVLKGPEWTKGKTDYLIGEGEVTVVDYPDEGPFLNSIRSYLTRELCGS